MSEMLPSTYVRAAPFERKHGNTLGTAALWAGIAACIAAFFPLTSLSPTTDVFPLNGFVTWPTMIVGGLLGAFLGVAALRKTGAERATNRTTAKVALALSIVSLEMCVGWAALHL
ncbi:hypothetical protein [Saccharopolyspora dendranthemae]|uniref:Uncharacterized protein n=1 Tax=Saccharopolyspora dendranthemae TaxID=1181886 RepID=A0A561U1J0_9PSEU|nr:hypothetical protein [Saccharopolyspora dendranthemae]TWF93211.1 hypothetical protein FHU35_1551 [Saccharopolyspora dendranthemae]